MLLKYNPNWRYFILFCCFLILVLMSLSLWQCSVAWLKKYKIAEFVEKRDLLENRYQQLLIEKSKLTSYKRIKEIALSKLNMHSYTSTPYFININRDF